MINSEVTDVIESNLVEILVIGMIAFIFFVCFLSILERLKRKIRGKRLVFAFAVNAKEWEQYQNQREEREVIAEVKERR